MRKKRFSISMPKGYSKTLHALMIIISLFGIVMVTSAEMSGNTNASLVRSITKQLIFILLGYSSMVFLARNFTFKWFRNGTFFFYFILIGLIVFNIIPRFFPITFGAYNWIRIPGVGTIQPSEITKPIVIAIVAVTLGGLPTQKWMLDKTQLKKIKFWTRIKRLLKVIWEPVLAVFVIIGIILLVQRDLGTAMIILMTCIFMFFTATHPFLSTIQKPLFVAFVGAMGLIVFLMSPSGIHLLENVGLQSYQLNRITSLYNLFDSERALSTSMQQVNGLLAFARGGLFGNGLGNSILKYGYIPATESDYILAIIIDETGFFGFLFISIGFLLIIGILFKNAFKMTYQPARLYLIGTAVYIFIHYLFNVGGTSGLVPLTGVPLLLLSAGGSSQLACFMAIGVCQRLIADYRRKSAKKA